MKKNGFTLIELIGAILIVGLISAIVVPAVTRVMRTARENAYEEQIDYIEKAAQKWSVFNANKVSEFRNYYLSTDDLLTEGYIDGDDIADPRNTDNKITGCVVISYDNAYSQYLYEYNTSKCSDLGSNVVETAENCFTVSGNMITGYTCSEREITIPQSINGTKITTIGDSAFKTKYLEAVILQEGLTTIAASAFEDNRLKEIIIPASVTTIGSKAFYNNQLTVANIPNTVNSIGSYAYANNKIINITLSTSITNIPEGLFMNNSIGGVTISTNIKTIGASAFKENNISNLTLKSGVQTIDSNAFMDNNLTYVNFPATTKVINANAFTNNVIKDVKLPSSLETYSCDAFSNNGTTHLTFLNGNTALANITYCSNTNNRYSITNVNVPVGSASHYSSYDSNKTDNYINSWNMIEQ